MHVKKLAILIAVIVGTDVQVLMSPFKTLHVTVYSERDAVLAEKLCERTLVNPGAAGGLQMAHCLAK